MSKTPAPGDGKAIKGPAYSPPDIAAVLSAAPSPAPSSDEGATMQISDEMIDAALVAFKAKPWNGEEYAMHDALVAALAAREAEVRRDERIEKWLAARAEDQLPSERHIVDGLLTEYRQWADATYGPAS